MRKRRQQLALLMELLITVLLAKAAAPLARPLLAHAVPHANAERTADQKRNRYFQHVLHSAARCRPPSEDHPIARRFTAQSSRLDGRPVTHVPHCSRGRNLSKVRLTPFCTDENAQLLALLMGLSKEFI